MGVAVILVFGGGFFGVFFFALKESFALLSFEFSVGLLESRGKTLNKWRRSCVPLSFGARGGGVWRKEDKEEPCALGADKTN